MTAKKDNMQTTRQKIAYTIIIHVYQYYTLLGSLNHIPFYLSQEVSDRLNNI